MICICMCHLHGGLREPIIAHHADEVSRSVQAVTLLLNVVGRLNVVVALKGFRV
jgi:hypothetical protein